MSQMLKTPSGEKSFVLFLPDMKKNIQAISTVVETVMYCSSFSTFDCVLILSLQHLTREIRSGIYHSEWTQSYITCQCYNVISSIMMIYGSSLTSVLSQIILYMSHSIKNKVMIMSISSRKII